MLAGATQAADAPAAAYGMVLTYSDPIAKTIMTSAIILYPTKAACDAAMTAVLNYQAGREAALHPDTLVNAFCLAASPTTSAP